MTEDRVIERETVTEQRRLSSPVRHEVVEITEVAPPLASAG
jgi:hypothetical protein